MANNQKTVQLVVRARDESQRVLNNAKTALDRFTAAQAKTAARRGLLAGQEADARRAYDAYGDAAAAVEMLGRKIGAAKRPSAALREEFDKARTAARLAKQEFVSAGMAYAQSMGKVGKGTGSFAAFDAGIQSRANAVSATAGVNALGNALERVAAYQQRVSRFAAFDAIASGADEARIAATRAADEIQRLNNEAAGRGVTGLGAALGAVPTLPGVTDKEKQSAEAAAQAQRGYAAALRAKSAAADEVVASERALTAVQMQTDASAEQLVAAQRRVTTAYMSAEGAANRVANAQKRVDAAQKQVAQSGDLAGRQAASWATRKGRGPLGLRPFELQNLSYQINDVFTQIASGTPVMQVAAQQGGQFIQIFPKLGGALLRALPIIGMVTIALSPFITAMNRASSAASTLKDFDLLLTRSGEGASYQAARLADAAQALDEYDGSLKDAKAALTEFVGDSVAPEYLERFGKTALDVARVLKIDVADAAKQVSDAFTGNADAVLALDDQLNFLTDTEHAHIQKLRESKRDAEARTEAFAIFERRYGETADKMRGPWTRILNDFAAAWGHWVDSVNFINFDEARGKIAQLMNDVARLMAMLPGARDANTENAGAWVDRAMADRNRRALAVDDARRGGNVNNIRQAEWALSQSQERLRQAEFALARNQLEDGSSSVFGARQDPADTTLDPPAPANSGRSSGASEAERRAKAQAEFLADLQAESAERQFQLTLIDMEERERRVLEELRESELAAAAVGLKLSPERQAEIRKEVEALYDAEKAHEAVRLIEQARLELAQARGEVEGRDDFVQRKVEEAGLFTRDLDEATGELVVTLTKEGQDYQDILRTLYDINEATRQRQVAEKQVNDLMSLRDGLVDRERFLRDTGRNAEADAVLAHITAVDTQIVLAADNAIAMWRAIGGPAAEAAIAVLQTARDTAAELGAEVVASARQINGMLSEGGLSVFDNFARAIGQGANAFQALRDAFLQFAADFLSQIARMIAQQAILNLMRSAGMGKDGGGGPGAVGSSWLQALFRHQGGLIGAGGGRNVPMAAFANATRYHTGGVIGLKPNERAVIAEMGEEMLTSSDPRHRDNLGKGGGKGGSNVKVVNVLDPVDMLDRALASDAGERILFNFVRRNPGAFKAAIG